MAIPRYKGVQSISKITSWFLKNDNTLVNPLWGVTEIRTELNNWLINLFGNPLQSEISEIINILFHEFTYLSLPQLQNSSESQESYHELLTLVVFQNAQLRISGCIYQQLFKKPFTPYGNPFLILGYFNGFTDYYRVLGLDSSCSGEEIKKAYRTKAKTLHPDAGGEPEAFKQLKEAYDVLSDKQQRETYNEKYDLYQNRYDYDINSTSVENQFENTPQKTQTVIRINWRALSAVMSSLLIIGLISTFVTNLNHGTISTKTAHTNQLSNAIQEENVSQTDSNNIDNTGTGASTSNSSTNQNDEKSGETTASKTNSMFTLGSTKDEVINVMGEPDEKQLFGNVSSWRYQDSTIDFDENEKVAGWSNFSHILKVSMGTKQDGAAPFTEGSKMQEVVNAMGTPDEVTNWGALWHYQNSVVELDGDKVVGWSDDSGVLLTR